MLHTAARGEVNQYHTNQITPEEEQQQHLFHNQYIYNVAKHTVIFASDRAKSDLDLLVAEVGMPSEKRHHARGSVDGGTLVERSFTFHE